MLAAGLIAAGLFNLLWTSGLRVEARRCAESAAISAGHSYLSDDLLRTFPQSFENEGRAARCREAALTMADEYCRQSALPTLAADDVQLSWPVASDILKNQSSLVPTKITVAFDGHDDGLRFPLFFGGLTGLKNTMPRVAAAVSMEHSPIAFRPGSQTSVPMLPFAITNDSAANSGTAKSSSSGHWTKCVESGHGQDQFSWNSELQQFELGPDGLAEIQVTLYSGSSTGPDAFVPLGFAASHGGRNSAGITDWIESGLTATDLQSLGLEEVSFPGALPAYSLSSNQLRDVSFSLQSRVGEPCLIALCAANASASPSSVKLTRPVAARVIRVATSTSSNITVTLQPCVFVTATAINSMDPSLADNRYIYSVRLCE